MNLLTPFAIPEGASDFRLLDRKVIDAVKSLQEKKRFMKGIYSWVGFNVKFFDYETRDRLAGDSKWSFFRKWNFALDGIFSYSTVLLRIWSYLGFFVALISLLYGFWIGLQAILFGIQVVKGVTTIAVFLFAFNGLIMLSIGILGEYIARVFEEIKNRPLYFVKNKMGFRDDE
jgi:glycosyltransferase involved in cell wall biosynthesis